MNEKCCKSGHFLKNASMSSERKYISKYDEDIVDEKLPACMTLKQPVFNVGYQVSHGGDVHKIVVSAILEPKVKDLMQEIEKTYKVPRAQQQLIYKGIKLHECPNMTLKELDVFPMSLIRLAGLRSEVGSSLF